MWRDILLVAIGLLLGLYIGSAWCFCVTTHPDEPLPPLK